MFPMDTELALSNNISNFSIDSGGRSQTGLVSAKENDKWKAEFLLSGLGFSEVDFTRSPQEFSGGTKFCINLAKMLIAEPDMLLLDEPTNYLDILRFAGFHAFYRNGTRVLLVTTTDPLWTKSVHTPWQFIDKNKK